MKSPKEGSEDFEYRVAHAQSIDNIYWDDKISDYNYDEPNPSVLLDYFGKCEVMDESRAYKKALDLEREVMSDDFCAVLEYGISVIQVKKPFGWYSKNA